MRYLTIEKNEGPYTLCSDKEKRMFAIETKEMPDGAQPGNKIKIDNEGIITLDPEANSQGRNH